MSESTKEENVEKKDQPLDLSSLEALDFGPAWGSGSGKAAPLFKEDKPRRSGKPSGQRPNRRGPPRDRDSRPDRTQGRSRRPQSSERQPRSDAPYRPKYKVDFYPEDDPFTALTKALRTSCKTYELFEIAKLILEKPERFVAVVAPGRKAEPGTLLYAAGEHNLAFETEAEALDFALKNSLDKYFTMEEIEVDPPKGAFAQVNKCSITGELIAPPNYHRYQDLLKEHHAARLPNMPFERFQSKIEAIKDEEQIQTWVAKMSKATRYTVKDAPEGQEPQAFTTWEEARAYLMANHKESLVHPYDHVRFSGTHIDELPDGEIKRSVQATLERQKEFPLDTANNLRGRMRRMKFAIYKKNPEAITYVCAVKRKFRTEGQTMTENLQKLIDFLEANQKISITEFPLKLLGVEVPEAKEGEEAPAPPELSEEQKAEAKKIMLDLHWLVSEGYVTEYGDGTLFIPEPQPVAKPKEAEPSAEAGSEAPAEEPKAEAAPAAQEPKE